MIWTRPPVEFFATEAHYVEHLAPIWHALAPEERGTFHVGASESAAAECVLQGIPAGLGSEPWEPGVPTVVASWYDLRMTGRDRPVVFVEHGAGQTYRGVDHGGWAGGEGRDAVVLFLCPNRAVAAANLARYPEARVEVVGCPKLDWRHRRRGVGFPDLRGGAPVVAFSFHWDCPLVPETRATWHHWLPAIGELAARPFDVEVLGHAHPKAADQLRPLYDQLGVEFVPRFDDVLARADLYCADNSSTLYEFASLDRPVLALNHPDYRRDVVHGLRFWRPPGLMVDRPDQLEEFVGLALHDGHGIAETREARVREAYAFTDGMAAHRAAHAIRSFG